MTKLTILGLVVLVIGMTLVANQPGKVFGDSICDQSVEGFEFEKVNVIDYQISTGEFIELCVDNGYNIFEIYLSALEGGTLTIEIPKSTLPHFDYYSCIADEYTINYEEKLNPNVKVNQISSTDTTRTLQIQWDEPVYLISYFRNTNHCIDSYVENGYDPTKPFPRSSTTLQLGLSNDQYSDIIDYHCSFDFANVIHLNHTITSGNLKKICSIDNSHFYLELESVDDDGYLILDLPKDVFAPDSLFEAKVYSPLYLTDDDMLFYRLYIPDIFVSGLMDANPGAFLNKDEFLNEFFGIDEKNKHLQIHKSSSHDIFDRYKIPLLKGDTLLDVFFQISASESYPQYNPDKYHTPIQSEQGQIKEMNCSDDKVEMQKLTTDKMICVYDTTAQKLIIRGYAKLI